jgi:hypothetical protein
LAFPNFHARSQRDHRDAAANLISRLDQNPAPSREKEIRPRAETDHPKTLPLTNPISGPEAANDAARDLSRNLSNHELHVA